MLWSSSTLLAACFGLAIAHGDEGFHVPKLVGAREFLSKVNSQRAVANKRTVFSRAPVVEHEHAPAVVEDLLKRQNTDGQCGAGFGKCATGYCCSSAGWCGQGKEYCAAPDCQINYGPACDGNQKPSGADTSSVTRTKVGAVEYGGAGIYDCVTPGDIAITYDDGPYIYTSDLLDILKSYGAKVTFFMTGNNLGKGQINDPSTPYPALVKRMIAEGHQVASHSWSHENQTQLTTTQFKNQIVWNEMAINSILGFFPTYWRPPYSICDTKCASTLASMGYHTIYFDLDTEGYLHDSATEIQVSKNIWDKAINGSNPAKSSFLNIEHELQWQSVYNLTAYMLKSLFQHGYKSVTVGDCLGDPKANWYRTGPNGTALPSSATSTTSTTVPAAQATAPLAVSEDGSCTKGVTCLGSSFGSCCSQYGFCGKTADYCGDGCQSGFGTCGSDNAVSSSSTSVAGGVSSAPVGPVSSSTTQVLGSSSSISTTEVLSSSSRISTTSSTSSTAPAQKLKVSTNGRCGTGVTCLGSRFGECCGQKGFCGSSSAFCGTGCQSSFGRCSGRR